MPASAKEKLSSFDGNDSNKEREKAYVITERDTNRILQM